MQPVLPLMNPHGVKRLAKELKSLKQNPIEDAAIEPDRDEPCLWIVTIKGPAGSPYEGGIFNVLMDMTNQYPFKEPKLTFDTKIYHPAISTADGQICNC